ncbi:SEC-C motif protein [uncultured archaeon]|nr:SEC-C motif protein [uncultured archaeon]
MKTRLQPSRLWNREGVKPTAVALHGFSAQFDDWIAYKRGNLSTPPRIELEIPIQIKEALEELRKRGDYASQWISFALLDMSDSMLGQIAKNLIDLRTAELTPGMFRRCTYSDEQTVVSLIGSLDLPQHLLEQKTEMRAVIEKYRHKAIKSIGLGIMVNDNSKPFHCASWVEGPWEYDDEMEKLMQDEPPFIPAPGTELPGRNAPCLCGSGKKFKKCCLRKIQAARGHMG